MATKRELSTDGGDEGDAGMEEQDLKRARVESKTDEAAVGEEEEEESGPDPVWQLQNLHLKKIIKENHGLAIHGGVANRKSATGRNDNLVATLSEDQVNIYDNEHCGDHLDIFLHFRQSEERLAQGCRLTAAGAWLPAEDDYEQLFVFGDVEGRLYVLSISYVRVIAELSGHGGEAVLDIAACQHTPGLVASVGGDNTMRVWHVPSNTQVALLTLDNTPECVVFDPVLQRIWVSTQGGVLMHVDYADVWRLFQDNDHTLDEPVALDGGNCTGVAHSHGEAVIDQVLFVPQAAEKGKEEATRVLTKDVRGQIQMWQVDGGGTGSGNEESVLFQARVPDACRTKMDVSSNGRFLAVGNATGAVLLYDLHTPLRRSNGGTGRVKNVPALTSLTHRRASKNSVSWVQFGSNDTQILQGTQETVLLRFDFVHPKHFVVEDDDDDDEEEEGE